MPTTTKRPPLTNGPAVDADGVTFILVDRHRRLAGVELHQELGDLGPTAFDKVPGGWRFRLERPQVDGSPAVDRMEYLFGLEDHNGRRSTVTDPGNEQRAGGAFGDKSVITFPGYRAPAWLELEPVPGTVDAVSVDAPELDGAIDVALWYPESLPVDQPAPLLLVHDGPEFDAIGGFTHYLGALIATGTVPPMRAALLGPGERNDWYSANDAYAAALIGDVLREIEAAAPTSKVVGVGMSLGAVAVLHAHVTHPGHFDALLLQSGSFFTAALDPQEEHFSHFADVTGFVAGLADDPGQPITVAMTCGLVEENLANNRELAQRLTAAGYAVEFTAVRDAHNYTAWRDALDPHLTRLLEALGAA